MGYRILVCIVTLLCLQPTSLDSSIKITPLILEQRVAIQFVHDVRARTKAGPLNDKRVSEIVNFTMMGVRLANEKLPETPWYHGEKITEKEVLECIATEVGMINKIVRQSWEKQANIGYMGLRPGAGWTALHDLGIVWLAGMRVPATPRAYHRDKKFQALLKEVLYYDPKINIVLGTYILAKIKNLSRGNFEHTIGGYTQGRKSFLIRLRKAPKTNGLSKVARKHVARWKDWGALWNQIDIRLAEGVKQDPKAA